MPIEKTRPTRIAEDLAEKLRWVVELAGGTSADRLDPYIREAIEGWYAPLRPTVDRIQAAKADLMSPPLPVVPAHDLGGEG